MRGKKREPTQSQEYTPLPLPATEDGMLDRLTALSYQVLEQRLRENTASSQEVCTVARLGFEREKMQVELEKVRYEVELLQAKRKTLESRERSEEQYKELQEVFKSYTGYSDEGEIIGPADETIFGVEENSIV
jgi:hypothetical protein